jgi:hypothetical protein|tara:strand:- start:430 stop:918 length:489 start_codon:yes stop_codon:yes gene_type:complete
VPFKVGLKLLAELRLCVYQEAKGEYKCHFKDVIKQLTKQAHLKLKKDYDPSGIEVKHHNNLKHQWEQVYPDLKTKALFHDYTTGQIWAGIFIVKWYENFITKRNRMNQIINIKKDNFEEDSNASRQSGGMRYKDEDGENDQSLINPKAMKVIGVPQAEINEQ